MTHSVCLVLSVHQYAMPVRQPESLVIRMPDATPSIHFGVAGEPLPTPLDRTGLLLQEIPVLRLRQPAWMLATYIDGDPATPADLLAHVRLAATTSAKRLVAQYRELAHYQPRRWNEEPLPLAHEGRIAAAQSFAKRERILSLHSPDKLRLQGFDRRDNCGSTSSRYAGNKPVPLVVPAEELVFATPLPHKEQQVPHRRLNINHGDVNALLTRDPEVEVFTTTIQCYVDRKRIRLAAIAIDPARLSHQRAHTEPGELALD